MLAFSRKGYWLGDTLVFHATRTIGELHELLGRLPMEQQVPIGARVNNLEHEVGQLVDMLFEQHQVLVSVLQHLQATRVGAQPAVADPLELFARLGDDFVDRAGT